MVQPFLRPDDSLLITTSKDTRDPAQDPCVF